LHIEKEKETINSIGDKLSSKFINITTESPVYDNMSATNSQHDCESNETLPMKTFVKNILNTRRKIDTFLKDNNDLIESIESAKLVPISSVIKLAEVSSRTVKAPPLWTPGNPIVGAYPPAPQLEHMRAGMLGSLNQIKIE